jgi:hypothetical protein
MTAHKEWAGLNLDAEQRFVLTLARAFARAEAPERAAAAITRSATKVSSWQRVDQLLHVHRCNSVAYSVIRIPEVRDSGAIPQSFINSKREAYSSSFMRTTLEPPVLHRALNAMAAADVPALAIKGIAVGAWLYGDPALREHDDIDLLVPLERAEAADEVLKELGYIGGYRPPLYPGESPATASYSDPAGGYPIDLSFDPLHVFWQSPRERQISFDGWWSRRQQIRVGAADISTPGAEDQLLQLARHLQFHGYFRINWWIDLILLLRRGGDSLDWNLVERESSRHGVQAGLLRTLEMVADLYAFPLPGPITQQVNRRTPVQALHRRIWPDDLAVPNLRPAKGQEGTPIAPRFLTPGGVHPFAGLMLFLLDRRRRDYLRYLLQRIFPPSSWLRERQGDGSYPRLILAHWHGLRDLRKRVRRGRGL